VKATAGADRARRREQASEQKQVRKEERAAERAGKQRRRAEQQTSRKDERVTKQLERQQRRFDKRAAKLGLVDNDGPGADLPTQVTGDSGSRPRRSWSADGGYSEDDPLVAADYDLPEPPPRPTSPTVAG
jgi:hypothetical protein